MSLTAAIQIARSALTTSQLGIQVSGQNLANMITPGYSRQTASLSSIRSRSSAEFFVGRGVQVDGVRRQVNAAVQRRLQSAISDQFAATTRFDVTAQLENVLNELTGFDLSSELSSFYNSWSDAANLAGSPTSVVESGDRLAAFVQNMRSDLGNLREQIENDIDASTSRANAILDEIATINVEIQTTEVGAATANSLRDQRDQLVSELSELIEITTVENSAGNLNIIVGSTPIVLGGVNRGLTVERETINGQLTTQVVVAQDSDELLVTGGSLGGLIDSRNGAIDRTIDRLDELSAQLIFEVNSIHATGRNAAGLTSTQSSVRVPAPDRTLAFNDPSNTAFASLPFAPSNGGFFVEVQNPSTGSTEPVRIDVDLDGVTAAGTPGFGDDTTPEDIRAALDGVTGLNASWDPEGRLTITSDPGYEFSFDEDSSKVLGAMGVNSFFTGTNAGDIAVRQELRDDPGLVILGGFGSAGGEFKENETALRISELQDLVLDALGGASTEDYWQDHVQFIGSESSAAQSAATSSILIRDSLEAQRASVSGVDADEETVNLITFQQQYSGAARIIEIADQLFDELLAIV